jgi:hypothetical protein
MKVAALGGHSDRLVGATGPGRTTRSPQQSAWKAHLDRSDCRQGETDGLDPPYSIATARPGGRHAAARDDTRRRPWARVLGIVLCILGLLHLPFGTIVGVYGLWVLFSPETEALFRRMPPPPLSP